MINTINYLKKLGKETATFYFKQFKVEDGRSTMKVGTDAVLLGAVAEVQHVKNILEIGTGCGVIALILAQRSQARIDAIDMDEVSVSQAKENVLNSPWKDRITVIHKSLQDYIHQTGKRYDLIISNPPFFSRSLKSCDKKRNISRHNDLLSFDELISGSLQIMSPDASLWVILPVIESVGFIEIAVKSGLFIRSSMKIIPKADKEYHRIILHLKKTEPEKIEEQTLTIKNANNSYSREYIKIMNELYIDF